MAKNNIELLKEVGKKILDEFKQYETLDGDTDSVFMVGISFVDGTSRPGKVAIGTPLSIAKAITSAMFSEPELADIVIASAVGYIGTELHESESAQVERFISMIRVFQEKIKEKQDAEKKH